MDQCDSLLMQSRLHHAYLLKLLVPIRYICQLVKLKLFAGSNRKFSSNDIVLCFFSLTMLSIATNIFGMVGTSDQLTCHVSQN